GRCGAGSRRRYPVRPTECEGTAMVNPAMEQPKTMPGTVKAARALTIVIAVAVALTGFGLAQVVNHTKISSTDTRYTQADLDRAFHLLLIVVIAFFVVLAALHVLSAFLLSSPRNGGRVLAWIVSGLTVVCCGCGSGLSALNKGNENTTTSNGQT